MSSVGKVVLIADDDNSVRRLVTAIVASQGFATLEARNGLEALQLYGSFRSEIALVISDVQMPVMGGFEAADRMKEISPEVKVIFMSGGEAVKPPAGSLFIRKPFNPEALLGILRSAAA